MFVIRALREIRGDWIVTHHVRLQLDHWFAGLAASASCPAAKMNGANRTPGKVIAIVTIT
jgi:drug/metabolite transporter superfamily protein YnfA